MTIPSQARIDAAIRQENPLTRIEYLERTRQLCNLVNVRRVQVGKEVLRAEHIQRAIRLACGPEPIAKVSWGTARYSTESIPIDHQKVNRWLNRWEEKYAQRWKMTPQGLVPA